MHHLAYRYTYGLRQAKIEMNRMIKGTIQNTLKVLVVPQAKTYTNSSTGISKEQVANLAYRVR